MSYRLAGHKVYLAGPMDRVPDHGIGWRQSLTPWLHRRGILVLDPAAKPTTVGREDIDARVDRVTAKAAGDYDTLATIMKEVRRIDLRMIDVCDFVIVRFDMAVHMCGTYEEVFWANRQKKPVLCWVEQGKGQTPDWMFATLPHDHLFDSLEQLQDYVDHIDQAATIDLRGRWQFLDYTSLYTPEVLARLDQARCIQGGTSYLPGDPSSWNPKS